MAVSSSHLLCFSHFSSLSTSHSALSLSHPHLPPSSLPTSRRSRKTFAIRAVKDFWGDFGARDPFPEEIESNFGDKVLGFSSTEHKILIPNLSVLSLSQQECGPVSPNQPPIPREVAQKLLKKVVGWRLLDEQGGLRLQCLWKLRDFKCGVELINRIHEVVEVTGHFPNLHLEQPNQVRAELWTASIGGLSMNDFIVAAKIDQIKTADLVPKRNRAWA
ncbi:hypothetical protein Vadar_005039 [Vaccinium darrowii]|uniref:Uncharacterized protein n=1 Tax=Vaccinium darrowii TaxID=229202 RepID=A0ACB7YJN9_9ERIC|nr:hypothetical protein Vadar_005039 [Vaccinium darrowii]